MANMTESELLRAILDYLAARKVFCWRNNTGAFAGEYAGKKRFIRFGAKGSADILGCLPGGRFLAIECKAPGKPLSDHQFRWLQRVATEGGVAMMVDDLDEAIERIDEFLRLQQI